MIPQAFEYEAPDTVAEALSLLSGDGARVLAGGHSLLPMMKLRFAAADRLVDLSRISSLRGIRDDGEQLVIGAMTTHRDVASSDTVQVGCPVLADTAAGIGDMQVRNRGTIGGSIAQADPHGDLPALMLALEGEVVVEGLGGTRTIAAADLFQGFLTTSISADEILTEVHVPKVRTAAYIKMSRRHADWAIVGVAAVIDGGAARIGITGVAPMAVRATGAEAAYSGDAAAAAEHAADGLTPSGDSAGSSEYRAHLARVLTRRALEEAAAR